MLIPPPQPFVDALWPELQQFLGMVEAWYTASPFEPTSWWRSIDRNAQVGGSTYSQHLIGLAVDAKPQRGSMAGLAAAAWSAGFPQVVNEGDHVHVALWRAGTLQRLLNRSGVFL